jgi:hypothetical protein
MDDTGTVLLLLIVCAGCVAAILSGAAAWVYWDDPIQSETAADQDDPQDDGEDLTEITDQEDLQEDERYLIGRKETWLTMDYDGSRPKGKQCDVKDGMVSSLDNANDFQFTKRGSTWIVATDCDEDGKYTSYLSNKASDLIQARDKENAEKTQRWKVSCNDDGCTIRNSETKEYLNLKGTKPSLSKSSTRVRIARK